MNRRLAAEMSRLCVEKLGDSALLPALFALIRNISSRHPSGPELIRGSYIVFSRRVPVHGKAALRPLARARHSLRAAP